MNWTDLVDRVAARVDVPKTTVKTVLDTMSDEALMALSEGDSVTLKGLGRVHVTEQKPRTIRSIADNRKMLLGRRHVVRFRAGAPARRVVARLSDQHWRTPEHQAAWRRAETLVSDLELYHAAKAPSLEDDLTDAQVQSRCRDAFGPLWDRVCKTYAQQVPEDVRDVSDYLASAAARRWSD